MADPSPLVELDPLPAASATTANLNRADGKGLRPSRRDVLIARAHARGLAICNKTVFKLVGRSQSWVTSPHANELRTVLSHRASEVFADRWTPLVLRELTAGSCTFDDIHRGIRLVSRAVLIYRLRELENDGIMERRLRPGVWA